MLVTRVKTKFKSLVWVHQRYVEGLKRGESLRIEHEGKLMTISPADFKENPPQQGEETFPEQHGVKKGQRYHLYGFKFVPDDLQPSGKKKKLIPKELLGQCPGCLALEVSDKGKLTWQKTFVVFKNTVEKKCPACSVTMK